MSNAKQRTTAKRMEKDRRKNYWRIIPRYSPEYIRAIPRWLARGIWDAITDAHRGDEGDNGEDKPTHRGSAESGRRVRQIAAGTLNAESRGTVDINELVDECVSEPADADLRINHGSGSESAHGDAVDTER